MTVQDDVTMIRRMIEPLAAKAGLFRGRVLGMITQQNVQAIYAAVGEKGVRDAAEAIIRIGSEGRTVSSSTGSEATRTNPG